MQINWLSEALKKSKTFWVSVLVEVGAAEDTGSCMPPPLKIPYHKWEDSLFTLGILTLVKVEKVCLTGWTFLHLLQFKNVGNGKIKVDIVVAVDKLTV